MYLKHSVAFLILSAMLFCLRSAGANGADVQEEKAENKTAAKAADVQRITVEELKEMIAKSLPVTIIDARSAGSYDSTTTKIKGAIRMTTGEIPSHLKDLPHDREVVTYCT
ncbi:MAG TPA: rhodanese-like domain-containing protein [Blastocatellia bacterium]